MNGEHPVILYDGDCGLCHRLVRFVIRRDPRMTFRFAPLQSAAGQELLTRHGLPADRLDTVVLIVNGKAHLRSGASLRIFRLMPGLWPLLSGLLIVPPPIRDWAYDFIAKRRSRWFGRAAQCDLPTPQTQARFLA